MKRFLLLIVCAAFLGACGQKEGGKIGGRKVARSNQYLTMRGSLQILPLGHSSVLLKLNDKIIYIDPFGKTADYAKLPKADLILITHAHKDHLDKAAIDAVKKEDTRILISKNSKKELPEGKVIPNGYGAVFEGVDISATPAYNIVRKNNDGKPFHARGEGNGYLLNFGDFRLYIGGDTENIPELELLRGVDVAFLPNDPQYTMDDAMFIDAVEKMQPKAVYPYHYDKTDKAKLQNALGKGKDIKVK